MKQAPALLYRYFGDGLTDPALAGQECQPARRADGRTVVGRSKQLVVFGGRRVIVLRRRLRVLERAEA